MNTFFTAAQIAIALGKSKWGVQKTLTPVPGQMVLVEGKQAFAWSTEQLPFAMQAELEAVARKQGFRSAVHLLASNAKAWQPEIPMNEIADHCIEKALKLKQALEQMMDRRNDSALTCDGLEKIGCENYKRVFGYPISQRSIRDLFKRTLKRAGRAEAFYRWEIYLAERLARKSAEPLQNLSNDFTNLEQPISAFKNPAYPDAKEKQYLWIVALDWHGEQIQLGKNRNRVRRALLDFLFAQVPGMAATLAGLEKTFNRKLARWTAAETADKQVAALDDKRKNKPKKVRAGMNEADWKLAVYLSGQYENINLAFREWMESSNVSLESKQSFLTLGIGNPHEAPHSWRNAVKHEAALVATAIRGPRNYKLNSAFIMRDPNALASGDSDQSDDLTLPLYWYDETPGGEMFFGQGQMLAWIDERSWMIYNLNLIPDGAYSGFSIRNSWTNKADTWGLPRKQIHVENGLWRESKVFVGSRTEVGTQETEMGLRRMGIKFRHAQLPRGKLIERVFGSLQDLLHREPGYSGRNQITDQFANVQEQVRLVKSGKEHPSKFFLSKEQLMERLLHFIDKLNNTPKHGRYHEGLTPKEVYEKCFTTELVKIPDSLRYQLASNTVQIKVGRNGITFRYGKRVFNYKNFRTGQLRGQTVSAWFSPENPALLAVTNLDGGEPFVVQRSTLVPGCDAPETHPEIFAQAMSENAAHNAYGKELIRSLKPHFKQDFMQRMFRQTVTDSHTIETAKEFRRQSEAIQAEDKKQKTLVAKSRRASAEAGFPVSPERMQDNESAQELEFLNKFLKGGGNE